MTFRTRVFLAVLLPVALAAVTLDFVLARLSETTARGEAEGLLVRLGAVAAHDLASRPEDAATLRDFATELARAAHVRVTIVAADGVVIGESDVTADRLDGLANHADRPEIRDALARELGIAVRESATLGTPHLYVARTLVRPSGRVVLRLATPMVGVEARIARRRLVIVAVSGAALVLVAMGLWVSAFFLARRVRRLAAAAHRMAAGDYAHRLPDPPPDELGRLADALNRLADANAATIARLETGSRRVRAVLEAMPEGVMAVGPDGRISGANSALLALVGRTDDPTGLRPAELLRLPELLTTIDEALAGALVTREVVTVHPRPATLLVAAAPLPEDGGAVVVLHDMTELQRLDRVRRDFVANVSHELRNPVATVQAAAETLAGLSEDDADADRRRLADTIVRHAERMGTLVRDLLDLARIEAGQYTLRMDDHALAPVLSEALAAHEDRARAKEVTLTLHVDASATHARCDPAALGTVLANLLDNAVKYTRPGDRIELRTRPAADGVEIDVADTGPGIADDHLPRLFERFYRVDAGRSRELGGTGLGLAIVRHLVLAMGGQVRVRSALGRGATFTVALPRA